MASSGGYRAAEDPAAKVPAAYWADRGRPCVYVAGLKQGDLKQEEFASKGQNAGLTVEMLLGDFFYDKGCKVDEVRLTIDSKANCILGDGWISFEDHESVEKALALDGAKDVRGYDDEVVPLAGDCLRVSRPARRDQQAQEKARELNKEKATTDARMRELRQLEAKLHQMTEELEREYSRQVERVGEDVDVQIQEQRQLQAQAKKQIDQAVGMIGILEAELRGVKKRNQNLQRFTEDHHWEPQTPSLGPPTLRREESSELCVPPAAQELIRTISATSQRRILEDKMDSHGEASPEVREGLQKAKQSSRRAWADMDVVDDWEDVAVKPKKPSKAEEARVDAAAPAETASQASEAHVEADEPSDVKVLGLQFVFREVHLSAVELKEELREALGQLWKRRNRAEEPGILSIDVDVPSCEKPSEGSWLDIARGKKKDSKPPEATIVFSKRSDAAWLVNQQQGDFILRGYSLRAEGPQAPAQDFRRFRPPRTTDPDVASNISYSEAGTVHSHSSRIRAQKRGPATETKGAASADVSQEQAARSGEGCLSLQKGETLTVLAKDGEDADWAWARKQDGQAGWVWRRSIRWGQSEDPQVSLPNRTVLLEGLPTGFRVNDLRTELCKALERTYRRDGFVFDAEQHLHFGLEQGITVAPPKSAKDQNGGTCEVKFRYYCDAKWFVDQAKTLSIVGKAVRAKWRRPRGGR